MPLVTDVPLLGGRRWGPGGPESPATRPRSLLPRRLWQCGLTELSCETLAAVLPDTPSLAELHLGGNAVGDSGVRRLSRGLRDPRCRLRTLRWVTQCGAEPGGSGSCCVAGTGTSVLRGQWHGAGDPPSPTGLHHGHCC